MKIMKSAAALFAAILIALTVAACAPTEKLKALAAISMTPSSRLK